jgi:hypothetical protein
MERRPADQTATSQDPGQQAPGLSSVGPQSGPRSEWVICRQHCGSHLDQELAVCQRHYYCQPLEERAQELNLLGTLLSVLLPFSPRACCLTPGSSPSSAPPQQQGTLKTSRAWKQSGRRPRNGGAALAAGGPLVKGFATSMALDIPSLKSGCPDPGR